MAFIYNVTERKNLMPGAKMPVYAHATSRMMGVVPLTQISKSISRRSTVHRADVNAVLTVLPEVVMEYLSQGLSVRLGELGSFALRFRSKATASKEEFKRANVKSVHIRYTPGVLMLDEMSRVPVVSIDSILAEKKKAEAPADEESGSQPAPAETPGSNPASGEDNGGGEAAV